MPLAFADPTDTVIPIHVIDGDGLDAAMADLTAAHKAWAVAQGVTAALGQVVLTPGKLDSAEPATRFQ